MTNENSTAKKKTSRKKRVRRKPQIETDEHELQLAISASGNGGGRNGINERLLENLGIPYSFLSEGQWDEIKRLAGFRDSARFEVNIALRRYWIVFLGEKVSQQTKKDTVDTIKILTSARDALDDLALAKDLYNGKRQRHDPPPMQDAETLQETTMSIHTAIQLLSRLEERRARLPGQPAHGPLFDLIFHLDFIIYSQLGVRLSRSVNRIPVVSAEGTYLDYIWAVASIANLDVTRTTIDTHLARYITEMRRYPRPFPEFRV